MFDGTLTASPAEGAELTRLRSLYDGLLVERPEPLDDEAMADLGGMARIFDLDADRPAAEVWRDLRAVLTRQAPPRTDEAETQAALPAPRPLTLMLVEDDPGTAAALTEVLVGAGHGVVGPFSDAAAATTAAGLHAIDLALLDINLAGDGDGIGLARTLKQSWGVPVMFLSGDVAAAAQHARLAAALVLKPYSGRDVLEAIDKAARSGGLDR